MNLNLTRITGFIWLLGLLVSCSNGGGGNKIDVSLGVYDVMVVEAAGDLEFVISLSGPASDTVTVDYETEDASAVSGTDYQSTSGTLKFTPGEVRKSVIVPVIASTTHVQTSKSLYLNISSRQRVEISRSQAKGTIIDKDYMVSRSAFDPNWSTVGVFQAASVCESCHTSDGAIMQYDNPLVNLNSDDVSPSHQWQHTVMAHSFNDPYWQAAVVDETDAFPEAAGVIEDTCNTCHAPMGRSHAHHANVDLDADGYYRLETAFSQNHAREGDSCAVCHLIEDGNMGSSDSFSGGYTITDSPTDDKPMYGPYDASSYQAMNNITIYDPQYGAHVPSSELCATCHTLYTPVLDDPESDNFLEQGPYLEWKNSVYATGNAEEQQCQDCHMPQPEPGYATPITTMPNMASDRTPFGQHTLVGGNTHILELLKTYRVEQGIAGTTTEAGFNDQIAVTRQLLENSTADVAITSSSVADSKLSFDVSVTNNTGHKLPSSFPSRRAWLHVTVRNASDQVIFESGKPDVHGYITTDTARLKADCMSGHRLEGFDSSLCFEPHRDLITSPEQVAIYEAVLGNSHGEITHTILSASHYLKDNRIPPKGFTNSTAMIIEPQTVPVGVEGDNDFNCVSTTEGCGSDSVHYQVDVNGQAGPYKVDAQLLYQATQPAFVNGLHADAEDVNRFKVMYDAVPPSVEVLAETPAVSIN